MTHSGFERQSVLAEEGDKMAADTLNYFEADELSEIEVVEDPWAMPRGKTWGTGAKLVTYDLLRLLADRQARELRQIYEGRRLLLVLRSEDVPLGGPLPLSPDGIVSLDSARRCLKEALGLAEEGYSILPRPEVPAGPAEKAGPHRLPSTRAGLGQRPCRSFAFLE